MHTLGDALRHAKAAIPALEPALGWLDLDDTRLFPEEIANNCFTQVPLLRNFLNRVMVFECSHSSFPFLRGAPQLVSFGSVIFAGKSKGSFRKRHWIDWAKTEIDALEGEKTWGRLSSKLRSHICSWLSQWSLGFDPDPTSGIFEKEAEFRPTRFESSICWM
jgi:hypothetical protein